MYPQFLSRPAALILAAGCMSTAMSAEATSLQEANKKLIHAAFDKWREGTGGPFELLAEDATWTIAGTSVVAKTYANKAEFMDTVIKPFNARVEKPLRPTMRSLHGEGDTVIALFDAETLARDGKPYRNTYAWFMQVKENKIVKVTAFFDSKTFDDFWIRVSPAE